MKTYSSLLFILSLAILYTIVSMNSAYAGEQGGCAVAPCDCTSVGGRFHPVESKWCNYQLCVSQCMSERKTSSGGNSYYKSGGVYGAALGAAQQSISNAISQGIINAFREDPQEAYRKQMEAEKAARQAAIARERAEVEARMRAAEEARKKQETYDRLSSQLQLSQGFDGNGKDLPLILGDSDDGLRPQGTSFFGTGGGSGGSNLNNDSKVVDLRPHQGYSVTVASPANPGDSLPLIMGDPDTDVNVVDLRDKKAPLVVDPRTVKGETKPAGSQQVSKTPIAVSSSGASSKSGVDEFLFPGQRLFSKNPNKQLLNPLIELPKGESLPAKGENADGFYARLEKTKLGRKIADVEYRNLLFPADGGKPYPRGHNPVVDKIMDEGIGQIVDIEMNRIHEACQKAVTDMNAEWAEMEKKGIIRPGEDLSKKEKAGDVVYENAIMAARHRVYEQLEKDIRAAKFRSEHNLWILKRFFDQAQTVDFLGGPGSKESNDPKQMKSLLGKFMNDYSGDLK